MGISHVVRVAPSDGPSVIIKRARGPLTDEARILEGVTRQKSVPVPELLWSSQIDGELTMILEDFGPRTRDISQYEAATLAVAIHGTTFSDKLLRMDQRGLMSLFSETERHLVLLHPRPAWAGQDDVISLLHAAPQAGERLATARTGSASDPPDGPDPSYELSSAVSVRDQDWMPGLPASVTTVLIT